MSDEFEPMFHGMKQQMRPSQSLVDRVMARVDGRSIDDAPPATRLAGVKRWGGVVIGFIAGLALAAVAVASMSTGTPATPAWPEPVVVKHQPPTVSASPVIQDPSLYASIFAALVAAPSSMTYATAENADRAPMAAGSGDVSVTNTQVAGIDEGDIVKTDGQYIYVAHGRTIAVIAGAGADSRQVATIDTSGLVTGSELLTGPVVALMIDGTTLVALVHTFKADTIGWTRNAGSWFSAQASGLKAAFYDITDPVNAKLLSTITQSGAYSTSRLSDGVLYLVSNYDVPMDQVDQNQPTTYVPSIDTGAGPVAVSPVDVSVMPWIDRSTYTMVTAIDVSSRTLRGDLAVLGGSGTVYMSQDNLYLASSQWSGMVPAGGRQPELTIAGYGQYDGSRTNLMRIALNGGALALAAQGSIAGTLINQFALDEYDGYLRVATTWDDAKTNTWTQKPSLWVLDMGLRVVGSIDELVKNESIYSVRFDGPTGYVVTFRQRDPLFSIDLADPAHPTVQGALKIPGFSTYLHLFGDGRLLGIGLDTNNSGATTGVKLSMFNTTDPYDVTELATAHTDGDDTEVSQDHKAAFIDTDRGIIGFPSSKWGDTQVKGVYQQTFTLYYHIYAWDGSAFTQVKSVILYSGDYNQENPIMLDPFARGVRIGDVFYIVVNSGITAYDMASFNQIAQVPLN